MPLRSRAFVGGVFVFSVVAITFVIAAQGPSPLNLRSESLRGSIHQHSDTGKFKTSPPGFPEPPNTTAKPPAAFCAFACASSDDDAPTSASPDDSSLVVSPAAFRYAVRMHDLEVELRTLTCSSPLVIPTKLNLFKLHKLKAQPSNDCRRAFVREDRTPYADVQNFFWDSVGALYPVPVPQQQKF